MDDGSTIYLPFYHCSITVCITVCWCCRVLVMPVLLLLIVIVSVIIAINGYSCYSVAVYCWIACESCKLLITYLYVRVLLLLHYLWCAYL